MSRQYAYQRVLADLPNQDHPDVATLIARVERFCTLGTPYAGSTETIDKVWHGALEMIASGEASDPKALAAAAASVR